MVVGQRDKFAATGGRDGTGRAGAQHSVGAGNDQVHHTCDTERAFVCITLVIVHLGMKRRSEEMKVKDGLKSICVEMH